MKKILCLVPIYELIANQNLGGKVVVTKDLLKVLSNSNSLILIDWKNKLDPGVSVIEDLQNCTLKSSKYEKYISEKQIFQVLYFFLNFRLKFSFLRIFNSIQLAGEYLLLKELISQTKPDIIYSCYTNSTYQYLIPKLKRIYPKIRLINHFHHGKIHNHDKLDLLLVVNPLLELNLTNTEVVNPTISEDYRFSNYHCKEKSIAFVAKLWDRKNCELLIRSFLYLNLKDFQLNIVGTGPNYSSLFEKYSSDRVIFHGDISERSKISLLARSRLFVMPSSNEGFGISYLESLALGTPIIAYYKSFKYFKDKLNNLDIGLEFNPNEDDLYSLADKISFCLNNDKYEYEKIAKKTHEEFGSQYFEKIVINAFS